MVREAVDYVALGAVAFAMGLVRALVKPARRGLAGFSTAVVVGVCCGVVAAITAAEFGASIAWQYICASAFAIAGDNMIFCVLSMSERRDAQIQINGGQNQINQGNEVQGEQNQ